MYQPLVPCPACDRHVLTTHVECPFCAAALPADFARRAVPSAPRRLGRAAAFAFGASVSLSACGGEVTVASGGTTTGSGGSGGSSTTTTTTTITTTTTTDTCISFAAYGAPPPHCDAGLPPPIDAGGGMADYGSPPPPPWDAGPGDGG